jgi:hypothetical protein
MKLVVFIILLLDITFFCTESRAQVSTIRSRNITNWGNWGPAEYCASGHYAVGFRSKVQEYCGENCDDTAMNGIQLLCSDGKRISSSVGPWGTWDTNFSRCNFSGDSESKLNGFMYRVQSNQESGDDTATNAIRMKCSGDIHLPNDDGIEGSWYGEIIGLGVRRPIYEHSWIECPSNYYIYGLRTQVQPPQGRGGDNTALNNIEFYCRR